MPAIPFWPEGKCGEIWRLADCCPGIRVFAVRDCFSVELVRKINEQRSVGRQIRTPDINVTAKPLAGLEFIVFCVPKNQLYPLAWPSAKNHSDRGLSGQKDLQSATWSLRAFRRW